MTRQFDDSELSLEMRRGPTGPTVRIQLPIIQLNVCQVHAGSHRVSFADAHSDGVLVPFEKPGSSSKLRPQLRKAAMLSSRAFCLGMACMC